MEIFSLITNITSIILSVTSLVLSLLFYFKSVKQSEKTDSINQEIKANVDKTQFVFDLMYKDMFSLFKNQSDITLNHALNRNTSDDKEPIRKSIESPKESENPSK